MSKKEEWCPAQAGTYSAYEPEYLGADEKWHRVPTIENVPNGIPQPRYCGGINAQLGLFGLEQAWALAWQFAANVAASRYIPAVEIRVAQYEVQYSLKAKRLDQALTPSE